jgi:hypothetical protein
LNETAGDYDAGMKFRGELWAAALLLVGCGSSSSTGPTGVPSPSGVGSHEGGTAGSSGAGAGSCTASPVVWKDDGTTHCASTAEAILSTNTPTNPFDGGPSPETSLAIVTTQGATSYTFAIIVTSAGALGGTYDCTPSGAGVVEITYDDLGVYSTTVVSCSLSVTLAPTDGGMVAVGTFSADLSVLDGGTKTLSNGTFDIPVTMN